MFFLSLSPSLGQLVHLADEGEDLIKFSMYYEISYVVVCFGMIETQVYSPFRLVVFRFCVMPFLCILCINVCCKCDLNLTSYTRISNLHIYAALIFSLLWLGNWYEIDREENDFVFLAYLTFD